MVTQVGILLNETIPRRLIAAHATADLKFILFSHRPGVLRLNTHNSVRVPQDRIGWQVQWQIYSFGTRMVSHLDVARAGIGLPSIVQRTFVMTAATRTDPGYNENPFSIL